MRSEKEVLEVLKHKKFRISIYVESYNDFQTYELFSKHLRELTFEKCAEVLDKILDIMDKAEQKQKLEDTIKWVNNG